MSDLRAALTRSVEQWEREASGREADPNASGASLLAAGVLFRAAKEVRNALATPEPTLDAERLAEALANTRVGCSPASDPDGHDDCLDDHGADEVAAEYARLHERTEP